MRTVRTDWREKLRSSDTPMARSRGILRPFAGLLLLAMAALLLFAADIVLLGLHPGAYRIAIGNFRDKYFLEHAHRQEAAEDGTTYRWTEGQSTLWLNQVNVGSATLLTLDLGGRPAPAQTTLTFRDAPWVDFTAQTSGRLYTLLLPPDSSDQIWIGIRSETFQAAGDPRQLGIKLEGFTVRNLHSGLSLPPLGQYLLQFALLVTAQLTILRLGWPRWRQAALLAVLALSLAALLSSELLLAMEFLPRLLAAGAVLAGLTWIVFPLLERWATAFVESGELRLLWALTLGACLIRLIGVLYPSFGGQDLDRNLNRLLTTMVGQLYIIAPSGEFAKGLTIYPPGPYLGLMPGALLTDDTASLMQGGLALMDGFSALLTALLAHKLGGDKHAGRLALLLYAGNTTAFGAMSYSFSAQIFGQWFTAPLALLLLTNAAPPARRTWLFAMILLSFGVFAHIGVALLGIGWVGLILVFTTLAYRRIPRWGWGLFIASCLFAFGFLYVEIIGPTLTHASQQVVPRSVGSGTFFKGYRILLVNGVRLAYSDIGLALLPIGLWLMRPAQPGAQTWLQQRVVIFAWLGTVFFFLMVDLILDVQVRYFYFALPLVLALIALPLGRLASWNRWGQLAAWAIALAIVLPQIALWFSATWAEGKIPMTPLTH
jgi:hypothetical protein